MPSFEPLAVRYEFIALELSAPADSDVFLRLFDSMSPA
ncbi:hypothetical protein RISK_002503 [Rhodopirellula islandica]|uniref:Uncharacterized protein n=1 Tax=Rhodopirellula islandica TaxID=595434 RepID=A0A0J1BH55_RHOIS|nr:hypothetical protein RISK_002503 [Rhodopirellula islandica]